MNIFGYIKVGKRVSKAHQLLFDSKDLVIWYQGRPIIGTMMQGKWYQQDITGGYEQLIFQKEVTYVSFLPTPHDERERKNTASHRRASTTA